jgi:hypothetical protein
MHVPVSTAATDMYTVSVHGIALPGMETLLNSRPNKLLSQLCSGSRALLVNSLYSLANDMSVGSRSAASRSGLKSYEIAVELGI